MSPEPVRTPTSATALGLLVGPALGLAAAFGGFTAFLVVALLAAAGLLVGHPRSRDLR